MADLKKDTVKEEKIVKGENAAPDTTILPEESKPEKVKIKLFKDNDRYKDCLLYTSPSPRDRG